MYHPPVETRRAGVQLMFFSDGSGPAFCVVKNGHTQEGVNERLRASRKNRESLGTNPKATTLRYQRRGEWLKVDGDMGRMFPPQPWARGLLPLISMKRVFAFHAGVSRAFLEFAPLRGWSDEAARAVGAATWLILNGWDHGFVDGPRRTQDLLRVLSNMGLPCSARQFRESIAPLIKRGMIERTRRLRAPHYNKSFPGWGAASEGFYVSEAQPWFQELEDAFEPFAIVKSADVPVFRNIPFVK